jgi:hypothetical protein
MNKNLPALPVEIWDMIDVIRRSDFRLRVEEFEIKICNAIFWKNSMSIMLRENSRLGPCLGGRDADRFITMELIIGFVTGRLKLGYR